MILYEQSSKQHYQNLNNMFFYAIFLFVLNSSFISQLLATTLLALNISSYRNPIKILIVQNKNDVQISTLNIDQ